MKRAILILIIGSSLTACAKEPAPVAYDTFCITAKKREWSVNDSPESITAAERWNRQIDIRCGIPGAPSKVASR